MKKYIVSEDEINCAKTLQEITTSISDTQTIKNICDLFYKNNFKTIITVEIIDEKNSTEKVAAALLYVKSKELTKMFEYDGILKVPKHIFNSVNFKYTTVRRYAIISALLNENFYNVDSMLNIDYTSLTMRDIMDYIHSSNCADINMRNFATIKKIISIFIIQLLTPSSANINKSDYIDLIKCSSCCFDCKDCVNKTDTCGHKYMFDKHISSCHLYLRGVVIVKTAMKFMEVIPYDEIFSIYFKCLGNFKDGYYINNSIKNIEEPILIKNEKKDQILVNNRYSRFSVF